MTPFQTHTHLQVQFNSKVVKVVRPASVPITVALEDGSELPFDQLIWATSAYMCHDYLNIVADATSLEQELFSKVHFAPSLFSLRNFLLSCSSISSSLG